MMVRVARSAAPAAHGDSADAQECYRARRGDDEGADPLVDGASHAVLDGRACGVIDPERRDRGVREHQVRYPDATCRARAADARGAVARGCRAAIDAAGA